MIREYDILETLGARYYAYQVLRSLFGVEPTPQQFAALREPVTYEAFEAVFANAANAGDESWRVSLNALVESEYSDSVFSEFTKSFVGPGPMVAPPWESVYVNAQPLLFQENTINVRKKYLRWNFIPRQFPHVPDDQLSLELDFMERLSVKLCEAHYAGDEDEAAAVLQSSIEFLADHLARWVGSFHDRLAEDHDGFYTNASKVLELYVQADLKLLASMA